MASAFAKVLKISIIQSHVVFVEERNHPWVSMSMVNSPMLLFCCGCNYNFAVSCDVLSLVICDMHVGVYCFVFVILG